MFINLQSREMYGNLEKLVEMYRNAWKCMEIYWHVLNRPQTFLYYCQEPCAPGPSSGTDILHHIRCSKQLSPAFMDHSLASFTDVVAVVGYWLTLHRLIPSLDYGCQVIQKVLSTSHPTSVGCTILGISGGGSTPDPLLLSISVKNHLLQVPLVGQRLHTPEGVKISSLQPTGAQLSLVH